MIALAEVPMNFMPTWGAALLVALGLVYLVLGSRWPRLFDVLSMTVVGCAAGLAVSGWVPLNQAIVVVIGGIVLGGLTALVRNIGHGVLVAIVLGVVLACFAAMIVGEGGFTVYRVADSSGQSYSVQVPGPNLTSDPVLAAWLTGLLGGAAVAVLKFRFSERLATSAQGAALTVIGAAQLVGRAHPDAAGHYPLTMAAAWLCVTAIGIAMQQALAPPEPDEAADDEDPPAGRPARW